MEAVRRETGITEDGSTQAAYSHNGNSLERAVASVRRAQVRLNVVRRRQTRAPRPGAGGTA